MHVAHCPEEPQLIQLAAVDEDAQQVPMQLPEAHALLAVHVPPAESRHALPVRLYPLLQPLQAPAESQELHFAVVDEQHLPERQFPDAH